MRPETRVIHAGRHPEEHDGAVNPPVVRTSTVLSSTMGEWERRTAPGHKGLTYGRHGTSTTRSLEEAVAELEGGFRSMVYPSGLAANVGAILPFVGTGDHILLPDTVYDPVRRFATNALSRLGITASFYDPLDHVALTAAMRDTTRVVYVESPGSLTFEVQDIPAIAAIAHARGAKVVMDNTWATPLYFQPFAHGVDVSVQAATKYIVGHSDVMLGVVTTNEECWKQVKTCQLDFGQTASPDDLYLAQRGLRTMHVRLRQHWEAGIALARFIARQPEVERVMHPALPEDPSHELWQRDFLGASGLFGMLLRPMPEAAVAAFVDNMALFNLGASWGGYETLLKPMAPGTVRTATRWTHEGPAFRVHAGLENLDDLLEDLETGFKAMRARLD